MTWTLVQTKGATQAAGTSLAVTLNSATTAGNLLIVFAVGKVVMTYTDSAGQTYTTDTRQAAITGSTKNYQWAYVLNTAGGVTSVTVTGDTVMRWIQVMEYQPPAGTAALVSSSDTPFNNGAGGTTIGGSLGGSAASGSLVLFGVTGNNEGGTTFTAGTGISNLVGFGNDTNGTATTCVGDNRSSSSSPSANITISPSNNNGGIALAFTNVVTTDNSTYDPARVPNGYVGPIVLRHAFRQPNTPFDQTAYGVSGTGNLDFEGTGTLNYQDPSDYYRQVIIPNPFVGPPALRIRDRQVESGFESQAVGVAGTGNLDFEGTGTINFQDPADYYRQVIIPNPMVGPPAIRYRDRFIESGFKDDIPGFFVTGTGNLDFEGAGTINFQDPADFYRVVNLPNPLVGPPALRYRERFVESGFKSEVAGVSGTGNLDFEGTGTLNFQDPADYYRQVILPNPMVGPPALRYLDRFVESGFKFDVESVSISGTGNLDFEGTGNITVVDLSWSYTAVKLPNPYVGPPVLRRRLRLPEGRYEIANGNVYAVSGAGNLILNGSGKVLSLSGSLVDSFRPVYVRQGDSIPTIQTILKDARGNVVDLTNAVSVSFRVSGAHSASFSGSANIITPASGYVAYQWDSPVPLAPGVYSILWSVTYLDSSVRTFPEDSSSLKLIVLDNLAVSYPPT